MPSTTNCNQCWKLTNVWTFIIKWWKRITLNLFPPKIEGCVWTKPGIWKWTNKDLPIVCLAQQQPWGAKNIPRIMWTMLTLIPITNKDISYNRKIFLRTDSCFEHWALIQCPFDLEKILVLQDLWTFVDKPFHLNFWEGSQEVTQVLEIWTLTTMIA